MGTSTGQPRRAGRTPTGPSSRLPPGGALTTLYSFCSLGFPSCPDGGAPGALIQGTNGDFYGTTKTFSPSTTSGTIFSLSVGLGPLVKILPAAGKTGASVRILGADLTGATSVSFNGTAAAFKVVSSTEIITTVPAGATSGKVEVVTPSGTLSSNVPFRVRP